MGIEIRGIWRFARLRESLAECQLQEGTSVVEHQITMSKRLGKELRRIA
jgi:hypothetical protein